MITAEYEEMNDPSSELDLAAEDSLPWLESDEDDSESGMLDTRQIITFGAMLLAFAAFLVGIVWYVSHKVNAPSGEPDGSIIAAPTGPIKERPEDPGGKEFAGTGNVAPLVGEGGKPEAVVATATKPAPAAAKNPAPTNLASKATTDTDTAAQSALAGVAVQLAAYSSRERAEQGWSDLSRRSETLQGARYRVVEGKVDIGTVFRLQAIAADRASADTMCAALKREGLDCQVRR
jgi:hypothetical protein